VLLGHADHEAKVGLGEVVGRLFRLLLDIIQVSLELLFVFTDGLDAAGLGHQLGYSLQRDLGADSLQYLLGQQGGVERELGQEKLGVGYGPFGLVGDSQNKLRLYLAVEAFPQRGVGDGFQEAAGGLNLELFLDEADGGGGPGKLLQHGDDYLGGRGVPSVIEQVALLNLLDAPAFLHLPR
jgi:hypothetical protein